MPPWRMMKLPWKHARQCVSQQSRDFRSTAAAEGQGQPQEYDWSKSTAENYSSPDRQFFGPYASIRSDRDHAYHGNYVRHRQAIQDKLIDSILCDEWTPRSTATSNPWVVFTCGAMGAGKSHVVTWMRAHGYFSLSNVVRVDPDIVRSRLPEWGCYTSVSPERAGLLTQCESGYCVEILQEAALRASRNIWVDGSLRNVQWYSQVFRDIRSRFPNYRIAVLAVEAPREVILDRAALRGAKTGRFIPIKNQEQSILDSLACLPSALEILGPQADVLAQILNGNDDADTDRAGPKLLFLRHNSPQPQSLASSMSTAVSPHITPNPLGIANDSGAPSDGVLGLSINHAEPHLDIGKNLPRSSSTHQTTELSKGKNRDGAPTAR